MGYIADEILDNGLDYARVNGNALHICSAMPTTYTEATATFSMGSKTSPTIGTPEDRLPSGRKVVVSAVTDGSVTGNGYVTAWALVDTINSTLLAAQFIDTPMVVTSGNNWTASPIDIGIPDAV